MLGRNVQRMVEEMPPYLHSDYATCIRDSEGSFAERRRRLHVQLKHSRTVTKMDLIQRNIIQGVNVVRRGAFSLEGQLKRRPTLISMEATGKLPPNYIDLLFPNNSAASVAPLAERKERVQLHQLLAPFPPEAPINMPGLSRHLGPEMFAAMLAQMAPMSPDQQLPPALGQLQPALGQLQPALGQFMPPGMPTMMPMANPEPILPPGLVTDTFSIASSIEQSSDANIATAPQYLPSPQVFPQNQNQFSSFAPPVDFLPLRVELAPTPIPEAPSKPPFVLLIEDFCERCLATENPPGKRNTALRKTTSFLTNSSN